jgi:hypothetical protein
MDRNSRKPNARIADCSDLTICSDVDVDGLAWQGIGRRAGRARLINEGREDVARLVAASRRSTDGEHASVNRDIGIAYVLVEPTAK